MLQLASIVLGAALSTVPCLHSHVEGVSPVWTTATMAEEVAVEGVVKSADLKGGSIVLSNGSKSITLRTDKSTVYQRDGKPVPVAEVVVVGTRVRIVHTDALATRIEPVAETPPAKAPGRSPSPAKPKAPAKPKG